MTTVSKNRAVKYVVCGLAIAFGVFALVVESVRLNPLIAGKILFVDAGPDATDDDTAITVFERLAALGICLPKVHAKYAGLLFDRASEYWDAGDRDAARQDLEAARTTLHSVLACAPLNSGQWLTLAMVGAQQDGVGDKTFDALRLAHLSVPRGYWAVKRRLKFEADIAARVPEDFKDYVQNDINVLRRTHIGTQNEFLKDLDLKTIEELSDKFK